MLPELVGMNVTQFIDRSYADTLIITTVGSEQGQRFLRTSRVLFLQFKVKVNAVSVIIYRKDFFVKATLIKVYGAVAD
jgi:hypothetical protein